MNFTDNQVFFTTLTIENWVPLFEDYESSNNIIHDSLLYFKNQKEIKVFAYVIMRDHIHLIWQILKFNELQSILKRFKQYTGLSIVKLLKTESHLYLSNFDSNRNDRIYKIWKLTSSSTRIMHPDIFLQKRNYIHENPTKGIYKSVDLPEEYLYSSAKSYADNYSYFPFLDLIFKNSGEVGNLPLKGEIIT